MAIFEHRIALIVGLITVIGVLVGFLMVSGLRYRRAFQQAAAALGLSWEDTGPFAPGAVTGSIDGESVRVFVEKQGSGSFQRQLTAVEIDLVPPLEIEFAVGRENFFTSIFRRAGVHDIEFEHPEFDKLYRVSGEDTAAVRRVLHADVRNALVLLSERCDDLHVRADYIRWEVSGRVYDGKLLVRMVRAAVSAARGMQNARS